MTLHGRQQLPRHKNLYVRDLRPVAILGLFVCAAVSGIRARAAFPRARTQSVSCLSAAKCRLLLVHGAQALPIPSPLPALAAASPSPPGTVLLPDFPACQAKITVFAPKITLVVFAPTCSLHASLSRLPQLSPSPCHTVLAGFPAHLSVYFPVFSPRFTLRRVFKPNLRAGGLFPLPPAPTSHQSPCLASPAERL